eukprot:TRINITY_DN36278_c0_g1_i1.p1 TRINITY_DN36278_c0_g1~~TRINITY_DN36278_c0_g1_i1.p1  ORF type:complete len:147 (-),score=21.70 TRINITY_DN36278_c0_g1_i1:310-750(-)
MRSEELSLVMAKARARTRDVREGAIFAIVEIEKMCARAEAAGVEFEQVEAGRSYAKKLREEFEVCTALQSGLQTEQREIDIRPLILQMRNYQGGRRLEMLLREEDSWFGELRREQQQTEGRISAAWNASFWGKLCATLAMTHLRST